MQTTQIPEIKKTIVKLRELSGDEKLRQQAFLREMQVRDEASAIEGTRRKALQEGRAEGRAETILNSISSLMASTKWTAQQAMDALGIPSKEQSQYLLKL